MNGIVRRTPEFSCKAAGPEPCRRIGALRVLVSCNDSLGGSPTEYDVDAAEDLGDSHRPELADARGQHPTVQRDVRLSAAGSTTASIGRRGTDSLMAPEIGATFQFSHFPSGAVRVGAWLNLKPTAGP